jgi:hypothetical protein
VSATADEVPIVKKEEYIGEVVPTANIPEIVEVAVVEVAINASPTTVPATESIAYGLEVPIPSRLFVLSQKNVLLSPPKVLPPLLNCTAPGLLATKLPAPPIQVPL